MAYAATPPMRMHYACQCLQGTGSRHAPGFSSILKRLLEAYVAFGKLLGSLLSPSPRLFVFLHGRLPVRGMAKCRHYTALRSAHSLWSDAGMVLPLLSSCGKAVARPLLHCSVCIVACCTQPLLSTYHRVVNRTETPLRYHSVGLWQASQC
jgi:hypothetical protein